MQVKKSLLVAGAFTTVGLASLAGAGTVSAATDTSGDNLVSKIARKFNLSEKDVQTVFDEDRQVHEADMQAKLSDRLQAAVDDGDITAEQKTLIENKLAAVREAMEAERDSLESWAEAQGIDLQYLMMHGRPGEDSSDYLQAAVDDGDITAEQKTAIEAKQDELQQARETAKADLEQWADDNGIDTKYLAIRVTHMAGGPGQRP